MVLCKSKANLLPKRRATIEIVQTTTIQRSSMAVNPVEMAMAHRTYQNFLIGKHTGPLVDVVIYFSTVGGLFLGFQQKSFLSNLKKTSLSRRVPGQAWLF